MLVFSCIAIGVVCVAAIARRTINGAQTNAPLIMPKGEMSPEPQSAVSD